MRRGSLSYNFLSSEAISHLETWGVDATWAGQPGPRNMIALPIHHSMEIEVELLDLDEKREWAKSLIHAFFIRSA